MSNTVIKTHTNERRWLCMNQVHGAVPMLLGRHATKPKQCSFCSEKKYLMEDAR